MHAQAEIFKVLHGEKGVIRVGLEIAELDFNGVVRLMKVGATLLGSGAIGLRNVFGLFGSFCKK